MSRRYGDPKSVNHYRNHGMNRQAEYAEMIYDLSVSTGKRTRDIINDIDGSFTEARQCSQYFRNKYGR